MTDQLVEDARRYANNAESNRPLGAEFVRKLADRIEADAKRLAELTAERDAAVARVKEMRGVMIEVPSALSRLRADAVREAARIIAEPNSFQDRGETITCGRTQDECVDVLNNYADSIERGGKDGKQ